MTTSTYRNFMSNYRRNRRNDEDLLRYLYYNCEKLFPADLIVRLFGSRTDTFGRKINPEFKEFAIRIQNMRSQKLVFVRYYVVSDAKSFRRNLGNICDLPRDVYIGAGYNFPPNKYKELRYSRSKVQKEILEQTPFRAIHHEFVLDLDLTDYDEIRTCCKGRNLCQKCWRFMAVACELIEHILINDFAVKHRLWLFSGGRGMHCWCFDQGMMTLTKEGRSFVVRHIQMSLLPLMKRLSPELLDRELRHPTAVAGYKIALKHIAAILKEQDCLVTIEGQKLLEGYMDFYLKDNEPDNNLRAKIMSILDEFKMTDSVVWKGVPPISTRATTSANENISERIYDLLLQFNVTGMNKQNHKVRAKITSFLADCETISNSGLPSCDKDVGKKASGRSLNVSERMFNLLQQHSAHSVSAARIMQCVVMHVTYPRIDDPVSRDTSHLLRCPLSVHTNANNQLTVPFRPENVAQVNVDPKTAARLRNDLYLDYDFSPEDLLGDFENDLAKEMVAWRAILEELVLAIEADRPIVNVLPDGTSL